MADEAEESTVGPILVKAPDPRLLRQRSVMLLNTGGTIGMKVNAQGSLESCPGFLAERLAEMRELQRSDVPSLVLYELLPSKQ